MFEPIKPAMVIASLSLSLALFVGGCAGGPSLGLSTGLSTGSLAAPGSEGSTADAQASAATAPRGAAASRGSAKVATPGGALALGRSLRLKGDKVKALAEIERGRRDKPEDRELAREAGIIALELGQVDTAKKALTAALDPNKPDWHTLSALGTAHATSGNQGEAQANFKRALELRPNHQPTLNNLALSYALQGDLGKAEKTQRSATHTAPASPQIEENLALVLALAGKYDAAEKIAKGVLPKDKAEANMAYLRTLTAKGG